MKLKTELSFGEGLIFGDLLWGHVFLSGRRPGLILRRHDRPRWPLETLANFVFSEKHELLDIFILDGSEGILEAEPLNALHPLFLGGGFGIVESANKIDLGGHQDKLVDTAILEVDFAQPSEDLDVEEAGFFANLADGGLAGSFTELDVPLGNSPATF